MMVDASTEIKQQVYLKYHVLPPPVSVAPGGTASHAPACIQARPALSEAAAAHLEASAPAAQRRWRVGPAAHLGMRLQEVSGGGHGDALQQRAQRHPAGGRGAWAHIVCCPAPPQSPPLTAPPAASEARSRALGAPLARSAGQLPSHVLNQTLVLTACPPPLAHSRTFTGQPVGGQSSGWLTKQRPTSRRRAPPRWRRSAARRGGT